MTEARAREILGVAIQPDGSLHALGHPTLPYTNWETSWAESGACLDGHFSVEELEAIIFWIKLRGQS